MSAATNVNPAETAKFDRLAARWWDVNGESRPLHDLNPTRLDYVAARIALKGSRVLDVGCGGGILSEALAARGKQPSWVKTLMAKGATLEDLHVDSAELVQRWLKRAGTD